MPINALSANQKKILDLMGAPEEIYTHGAAAAKAYAGRYLVYRKAITNSVSHYVVVANGFVVDSYTLNWADGKPVITPARTHLGACAWGLGLRKSDYVIVTRASLQVGYHLMGLEREGGQ